MATPPKKATPPKAAKQEPAVEAKADRTALLKGLSEDLSKLSGKYDDKKEEWIREPTPVLLAERDDGQPVIKLPGVFSTRIATIDAAIRRGGIPMARITTIAGGESCGKTTLILSTIAECQAMGGVAIIVDNEQKLDLDYARMLGVDLKALLLCQPGTIEEGLLFAYETIRKVITTDSNIPVFAALDSINASRSEKEYEEDGFADMTESNQAGLGAQARCMSEKLPKIARLISNKRAAFVMTSQPRDLIGTPGQNLVAGGNAPRFYSALILHLKKKYPGGILEESGRKVGNVMIADAIKNQVAAPYGIGEYVLRWGVGLDFTRALMEQASAMAIISKLNAGYFEMEDPAQEFKAGEKPKTIKWQGNKGWVKLAAERPEIVRFIESKVREQYR